MLRRRLVTNPMGVRLNASLGSFLVPAGAWPAETTDQCPRSTTRLGATCKIRGVDAEGQLRGPQAGLCMEYPFRGYSRPDTY